MIKLKYSNKYYDMIDSFDYQKSSREVKYSNIKIDFTGLTSDDLPKKYQECKIVNDNEVLYTGYANSYKISDMKLENDAFRSLEIELLSPMALATVRTVILKGTYRLHTLLNLILKPLLQDGFVIKEFNIPDSQITINFILKSVEYCMNKISNDKNIWWYIDENKNIYINSLNYLFSKQPVLNYENQKLKGLYGIEPTIDIEDYCNVINIKNVRVYSSSFYYTNVEFDPLINKDIKIIKGNEITFKYPIDINVSNIKNSYNDQEKSLTRYAEKIGNTLPVLVFKGTTTSGAIQFSVVVDNNALVMSDNVKISGQNTSDTEPPFELIRDTFFSNLIVGFKYNGSATINTINEIYSISCLKWSNIKFINNQEIEKQIGIISDSGQIEKTIDLNQQWKLMSEVTTIAKSYLDINSGLSNIVDLKSDCSLKINIGDSVRINKPNFLIDDTTYICTDIQYTYTNKNNKNYVYQLRNKNYLTNYVDLFRSSDEETNEDKIEVIIVSNYVEEGIVESHEVL